MTRTLAIAALVAALCLAAPVLGLSVDAVGPGTIRGTVRDIRPAGGSIWVASDSGVYRIDGGGRSIRRYTSGDGLPSDRVHTVSPYKGKVYAGTDRGLAVLEGDRWSTVEKILNVHLKRFVYTAVNPFRDELYVCSVYVSGGLLKFDGADWTFLGGAGRGLFNSIVSFGFTSKEAWLGTLNGVVYRMTDRDVDYFRSGEGFPGKRIFAIGTSGEKIVAATDEGIATYENGKWAGVDVSPLLGAREVYALFLSGGTILAGGAGGLVRISGKDRTVLADPSGRLSAGVFSLAAVDGVLYAGTKDGLVGVKGWE